MTIFTAVLCLFGAGCAYVASPILGPAYTAFLIALLTIAAVALVSVRIADRRRS